MDVRMRVRVPVHPFGEPKGVKLQEGIFEIVTREVEIECLPADIPEEFKVDVSELMIGKQLRAADLPFDATKMRLVTDPQRVLAHVVPPKKEEEVAAPEAVAVAEAAPAEPEVIKKGKKEAEEGEEGAPAEAPKEGKERKEKEK
jgi:large subunit ribosomal protein L25